MSFREMLRNHLADLDASSEASFNLWQHLPTQIEAEAHWGDHAYNFEPSPADVMTEAARVFMVFFHDGVVSNEDLRWWNEYYFEARMESEKEVFWTLETLQACIDKIRNPLSTPRKTATTKKAKAK